VDDPPVATNHGAGTAEDTAVGLTLSASDVDTAQQDLIFSVVTPPSNGGLSGTAPDLVYTPNPDYNGPDSFTFMANDGSNDSNVATVSLDVSPVNDAPAASNQGASTTEDTAVGLTLTASDVDNPPQDLTFSVVTPPVNGALSGTVPDLTYTPNPDYNGPDSFTFQVNDGAAVSNIATVSLNVTSVNDPSVADARSVTLDQDASTSIVLTASDADTPLENLVFNLLTSPASGSLTGTLPNLTYTPDPGYTGPDSFTFQVNDGAAVSNIATVSLTVTSATQFYFSVKDDTTLSGGLVVTDEDILAFDGVLFNKYFDGSDVGIAHREIDAFTMISATEILMSFSQDGSVPGIPLVEDTDIVRFTAASLGEDTAGVFDLYFHGRDVGLASNDDDVNSIELLPDGRILVSTKGNFTALGDEGGLNGTAHDIIALTPTSLGADTAGSWELYFDGSDVSLTTNNETISAVAVDGSGAVYLSTLGGFDVGNVAGDREDVFTFQPTALGTPTAGIYQSPLYFNGTGAHGLSGNNIYGFDLP
ncbi:MAG: Ig-like domain-containing protein, partial [Dehalococcoidia bacterium]